MTSIAPAGPTASQADTYADELRSRMYADSEFMSNVRQGWHEELHQEGTTLEDYKRLRGISG